MIVTCAALAAIFANPASAGTYTLSEDCRSDGRQHALVSTKAFLKPITVIATGRTVAGIDFNGGGNVSWRGGTIEAPGGSGWNAPRSGPAYYGVRMVNGSRNVTFEDVTFTNARKAIAFGGSSGLLVQKSRCLGVVEDCLIAGAGSNVEFSHNVAGPFETKPTECVLPEGVVKGLSGKNCVAQGGTFRDGWHGDVVQLRHGISNVRAAFNLIDTKGQGLTQMDTKGDAPISNVRFTNNKIRAGRHGLTLDRCDNCLIDGNTLETSMGHLKWRAVIIPGQAKACGNIVPSGGVGREPC